jgi:hypothetical protein
MYPPLHAGCRSEDLQIIWVVSNDKRGAIRTKEAMNFRSTTLWTSKWGDDIKFMKAIMNRNTAHIRKALRNSENDPSPERRKGPSVLYGRV